MMKMHAYTMELSGSSAEIGYQFGKMTAAIPPLKQMHTAGMEGFTDKEVQEAIQLFAQWCPGLADELRGFAHALEVRDEQVFYYAMTYLLPRCSQIAVLPSRSSTGEPLMARSYEFCQKEEDFTLIRTSVKGKYTHMGTSVLHFGRDEGINERGLGVTMTSCGFPVGAVPLMRAPKLKGLQFWAVIRALLENCADVQECLQYLKGMPIAYNINMILADKRGNTALVETLDGRMAVKQLGADSKEQVLWATNHPVLPELIPYEPKVTVHSKERYDWIAGQVGRGKISPEQLKQMLLSKYPEGLCCHYFEEYFGTTKSIVFQPASGIMELCWGGLAENGWKRYDIHTPLENTEMEIKLNMEKADPAIYQFQYI